MMKINIKNGIIEDIFDYENKKREIQEERDYMITSNSVSDSIINVIKSKQNKDLTEEDKKRLSIREEIDKEYESKIQDAAEFKKQLGTYPGVLFLTLNAISWTGC